MSVARSHYSKQQYHSIVQLQQGHPAFVGSDEDDQQDDCRNDEDFTYVGAAKPAAKPAAAKSAAGAAESGTSNAADATSNGVSGWEELPPGFNKKRPGVKTAGRGRSAGRGQPSVRGSRGRGGKGGSIGAAEGAPAAAASAAKQITPQLRCDILTVIGYAHLVNSKRSTLETWKNSDPELFTWYKRLYDGASHGQIKALLAPTSEFATKLSMSNRLLHHAYRLQKLHTRIS